MRKIMSSPSSSWLVVSMLVSSVCFTALSADDNCEETCVHGTCVNDGPAGGQSATSSNKTPKAVCRCDPSWSGSSCNIYACQGRTVYVSDYSSLLRFFEWFSRLLSLRKQCYSFVTISRYLLEFVLPRVEKGITYDINGND